MPSHEVHILLTIRSSQYCFQLTTLKFTAWMDPFLVYCVLPGYLAFYTYQSPSNSNPGTSVIFQLVPIFSWVKCLVLGLKRHSFHLWIGVLYAFDSEKFGIIHISIYSAHIMVYCHEELISCGYNHLSYHICLSIQFSSFLVYISYSGSRINIVFSIKFTSSSEFRFCLHPLCHLLHLTCH